MEKIKKITSGSAGVLGGAFMIALPLLVIVFIIKGGAWIVGNYYDLIQTINGWIGLLVLILLLLSCIPSIRDYTGTGIYFGTYLWGVLFWLLCLMITYELWGFLGVFAGLVFFGIGVFATAFLALIFHGAFSAAFMLLLNLGIIYAVRALGLWITTKHKAKVQPVDIVLENVEVEVE